MYRLVHYWDFVESDLFNRLTRELIRSIGTQTYSNRTSCHVYSPIFGIDDQLHAVRRLAGDLNLEDGVLALKCEEFERMNRAVLAGNH